MGLLGSYRATVLYAIFFLVMLVVGLEIAGLS
jgi:hypothetical protein